MNVNKGAHFIRETLEALGADSAIVWLVLRVTRGVNNYMMQFQSDSVYIVVDRTSIYETTACGVAYFAEFAVYYCERLG